MSTRPGCIVILLSGALTLFGLVMLIGCASATPPDPIIITKEVERIVQVRCADKRPPAPNLPDDPDELAAVSLAHPQAVFILSQKYVAARTLYRQRLNEDDAQIKACAGE